MNILQTLARERILPVLVIDHAADAVPLARALLAGRLTSAEITLRTADALESIRRVVAEVPEIKVGAGTVLSAEQAKAAVDAGAQFLVSPGFNASVVQTAQAMGTPIFPGCVTPTEVEAALAQGCSSLKFFPAEPAGGVPYLQALAAPHADVRFIPTGGISAANFGAYLALPNVLAVGGSWMATREMIAAQNWETITKHCVAAARFSGIL
ncbi:MAG: bifunctional 4-hydroxy-2-oxoglutarate aldolase/2-dehydro-3-deoxy-phosphogluconate aldolase [Oscillospiraceae bacterium]|nr:bifunctional 4-hydroxy-2-oxoglutarate aldolase/2-dehydro-3-deoxy-phosphogluconate aldolase [Oscillospiraceae bacterium]